MFLTILNELNFFNKLILNDFFEIVNIADDTRNPVFVWVQICTDFYFFDRDGILTL